MEFVRTAIPDVVLVKPRVHADDRGFFMETWQYREFAESGVEAEFVQDNHSRSAKGTLRGLHYQLRRPQGKLVRVTVGEVFDVAVDVRRGSPAFGRWFGIVLSAENFKQCYVPPGFAHGFCVLSPMAEVAYKCTDFYDPAGEIGIAWDDPALAIDWPVAEPLLSERDRHNPTLAALTDRLPRYGI